MSDRDEDVRRAADARQLLEHPLFKEAFETLARNFYEKWLAVPIDDTKQAERYRLMACSLDLVRAYLQEIIETGQYAEAATAQERAAAEFTRLNRNYSVYLDVDPKDWPEDLKAELEQGHA